ncbi:TPA: hypothetical protein ACS78B_000176 [Providencia alcalifaciens]|uniref:hypothetical protein n=1 Tax=Providencia alcalifaciens TaxID=126385 RepID=UPI001CC71131|nr:hypothetical protein [Providencia alcalifaciens]CAG9424655.1 hypothetical protein NVI2019_NGLDDFDA_02409 [Providencia alcalifaciens]
MLLKYIKKEIPVISVITVSSYLAVFFYYYGHSDFYGYPKEFISIDFSSLLSTGFVFFFISLMTIVNIRYFSEFKKINLLTCFLFILTLTLASCFVYYTRGSDYSGLYNEKRIYIGNYGFFMIPFFIYVGLRRYLNNRMNYKFLIFFLILAIFAIPYSFGWAPGATTILKSEQGFLLTRYGDFFVLGKCKMEKSSYQLIKIDSKIEFEYVGKKQRIQVNTCFNNSVAID